MLVKMQGKWKPHTLFMEITLGVNQKIKIDLPMTLLYHSSIYLKEYKETYKRDTCTSMSTAAPLTIANLWTQPRCPTADKQNVAYIQGGILSSSKEE
jgi:hypothetical protein